MENQDQELDEDITLLLSDAENALTALKGLGYKEEIEDLLGKVFPNPGARDYGSGAEEAFRLGMAEYTAGSKYSDWRNHPVHWQYHWRKGWISAAQEVAILSQVIEEIFDNAADHQYWLEAAKLILKTEAEHTKLKERRFHFEKVTKHLESHLRILRKITGQDEITVTTETLNTKEGQEEAKVGLG